MSDALSALESITDSVNGLAEVARTGRGRLLRGSDTQPIARKITKSYFEIVRPLLIGIQNRAGLVEEIDFVMHGLLTLATGNREKEAYLGHTTELMPYLLEAMVDLMKAGGSVLVLSQTERAILATLGTMLPVTGASYEQALRDLSSGGKVSWRGTGSELREVLREVIEHLAPDDQVCAVPGLQIEQGQRRPTQRQKVRHILRARRAGSGAVAVAESSLQLIDEATASLARSTYQRGSATAHACASDNEIKNLKRYVDALLAELLEAG